MYVDFSSVLAKIAVKQIVDVRMEILRKDDGLYVSRLVVSSAGPSGSRRIQVSNYGPVVFVKWLMGGLQTIALLNQLGPGGTDSARHPWSVQRSFLQLVGQRDEV